MTVEITFTEQDLKELISTYVKDKYGITNEISSIASMSDRTIMYGNPGILVTFVDDPVVPKDGPYR